MTNPANETLGKARRAAKTTARTRYGVRGMVKRSTLSAPYDWSNSRIGDEALIAQVLRHQRFVDVARMCLHHGVQRVQKVMREHEWDPLAKKILDRMLSNIRKELAHGHRTAPTQNSVSTR